LVATLALAIQAGHAEGIVHGGLNPGNVYLTPAGVPKITSFRRARLPGSDSDSTRPDTEIRRLACYLAPEQLAGRRRDVNRATDVYALAAILYTMLTGRPPFLGQTLQETLAQVQLQVPLPCRHWQPGIPPELETICLQCLQKQPSLRPASAELLADGLRNAVR
jgi:serine/threonine-protein kinase